MEYACVSRSPICQETVLLLCVETREIVYLFAPANLKSQRRHLGFGGCETVGVDGALAGEGHALAGAVSIL